MQQLYVNKAKLQNLPHQLTIKTKCTESIISKLVI